MIFHLYRNMFYLLLFYDQHMDFIYTKTIEYFINNNNYSYYI